MDSCADFAPGIAEQLGVDRITSELWSLSQSRKPASILGAEGRYTRESRIGRYGQVMSFGQMIGSGPPLFRVRQLLALVDAGLAHFLGDHPTVSIEADHFTLTSGPRSASAPTLVDAFMHRPDIRTASDAMTRPWFPSHLRSPASVRSRHGWRRRPLRWRRRRRP